MDVSDPAVREFVQSLGDTHGVPSWLESSGERVAAGRVGMRAPTDEKLVNDGPGIHDGLPGGVAPTLVDTAGGVALRTRHDDPLASVATIDLPVPLLDATTGDLVAASDRVGAATTVGAARVDVESETSDGDQATVAVGRRFDRRIRGDDE